MGISMNILLAEANPITIGIIVVVGFVVIMWFLFIHIYGGLWLQAKLSGVPMTLAELIGMTLRKVDAKTIVHSLILAQKAGLNLQREQLEVHYLCGGNVPSIVRAMITLDRAGINPGWDTLTADDLQGIDVLEEAQISAQKIRNNENNSENDFVENEEYTT